MGLDRQRLVPRFLGGIADHGKHVDRLERLEPRTRGILKMGGALPRLDPASRADEAKHARGSTGSSTTSTPDLAGDGAPTPEVGHPRARASLRTLIGVAREYPYTLQWNYTGQPAASIPLPPATPGGMPRAFQIVVPPNREDLLLSLGASSKPRSDGPIRFPRRRGSEMKAVASVQS